MLSIGLLPEPATSKLMFLFDNKALSQGKMVEVLQHSQHKASSYECHKGDNKCMDPLENLTMPFYFLHCHGKLFCNHGSNANFLT